MSACVAITPESVHFLPKSVWLQKVSHTRPLGNYRHVSVWICFETNACILRSYLFDKCTWSSAGDLWPDMAQSSYTIGDIWVLNDRFSRTICKTKYANDIWMPQVYMNSRMQNFVLYFFFGKRTHHANNVLYIFKCNFFEIQIVQILLVFVYVLFDKCLFVYDVSLHVHYRVASWEIGTLYWRNLPEYVANKQRSSCRNQRQTYFLLNNFGIRRLDSCLKIGKFYKVLKNSGILFFFFFFCCVFVFVFWYKKQKKILFVGNFVYSLVFFRECAFNFWNNQILLHYLYYMLWFCVCV